MEWKELDAVTLNVPIREKKSVICYYAIQYVIINLKITKCIIFYQIQFKWLNTFIWVENF